MQPDVSFAAGALALLTLVSATDGVLQGDLPLPAEAVAETAEHRGPAMVSIRRGADGFYALPAAFGEHRFAVTVDTGSSGVFLSRRDAMLAGLDVTSARAGWLSTPSGRSRIHWLDLTDITIADQRFENVRVGIIPGRRSLVGQDLLAKMGPIRIDRDMLTIGPGSG